MSDLYPVACKARDVRSTRPFLSVKDRNGYISLKDWESYMYYLAGHEDAEIDFDIPYVDFVKIKCSQVVETRLALPDEEAPNDQE